MRRLLLFIAALSLTMSVRAAGAGTASGLTLLKNSGARSSAMGEAFVAASDDVTAMEFNPGSLATLKTGHLSLQYEKGVFDDAFSKVLLGMAGPWRGTMGLSVGYYNSGTAVLFDGVNPERSVTAQQDKMASLAYALERKSFDIGLSVRYLKSELAETYSASAMSTDLGLQYQILPRLRLGAAGPLVQSQIQYGQTGENLPRVYRAGLAWDFHLPLATGALPFMIHFDIPYDATAHKTAYALGAETRLGIMALRLGTNTRSDIQQFSMGAGFQFGRMNLDYSFGMVNDGNFDSVHKVNLALRFDNFSSKKNKDQSAYQIYEVQQGETLQSIATSRYGSPDYWNVIFVANQHMYANPEDIKAGSRIIVPATHTP